MAARRFAGPPQRAKPRSDLEHLVMRRVGQAIGDHRLIGPGDRVLVGVSGGSSSFVLLSMLDLHRRRFRFRFELLPVLVDAGREPDWGRQGLARLSAAGYPAERLELGLGRQIGRRRRLPGEACRRCRGRRLAALIGHARRLGCNRLALGDHLDDLLEALLENILYRGRLQSLPIRRAVAGSELALVRPLAYVEAARVRALAAELGYPAAARACPRGCPAGGEADRGAAVRALIERMAAEHPRVRRSMLAAMKHLRPSHLLWPGPAG